MNKWLAIAGIGCAVSWGTAQAVQWNGTQEAIRSINLFGIQKTFYADLLPNTINRGKELVRISLKSKTSPPNAQGKVTDTHTLTTKLLSRAGAPLRTVPDMKAKLSYPGIPGRNVGPTSFAIHSMGIATGAGRQPLLVRSIWLEAVTITGQRQSALHIEVRSGAGNFAKKWSKAFKSSAQGTISEIDSVITDTDGDGIDELVLVREKFPRTNPQAVTKTTIQRFNIGTGRLIKTLSTNP